jgi:hypothetical protein
MEAMFLSISRITNCYILSMAPKRERGARPNINKASARLVGKVLAFLRYPLSLLVALRTKHAS